MKEVWGTKRGREAMRRKLGMRFKRGEYSEAVVPVGEGDVMCAVMDNRSLVIVTKTRKMEVLILDLKSLE